MKRSFIPFLIVCLAPSAAPAGAQPPAQTVQAPAAPADVIARVGDQTVTYAEVNTVLNSSAVVGVSIPAVGTPERDTVRITILDKLISANLVYLDALAKGLDRDPEYLRDAERFGTAILAGLYRQREMVGEIEVSAAEVDAYLAKHAAPDSVVSEQLRAGIEARIRRQKVQERLADARTRLRQGAAVVVYAENVLARGDGNRPDDTPVAEVDGKRIAWGEVKEVLVAAGKGAVATDALAMQDDARVSALEREIDLRLMAARARAAGLDQDPVFRVRRDEYLKSRLVNLHRKRLITAWEPGEEALRAYYEANRARFVDPEARKVQMVVVPTREQAEDRKTRIGSGDLTLYQAAQEYSTAARAKQDLGEVGWVRRGETVPALDAAIFAAGPGEIAGPVETPAGWHLARVQDLKEARHTSFDDPATRELARRRYLNEKLDAYTVALRTEAGGIPVQVDEALIVQLAQQEADAVGRLARQAAQPGSVTEQRGQELQQLLKP